MTKTKATTSKTSDSKLRTTQYAHAVVAGLIITSKKVYLACQRHLNDLKRQGKGSFTWVFDEKKGYRPVEYIERFCKPSQGDYDELKLQDWQHFVIGSMYGWVHAKSGVRRFKEALIYVGRKNGKTTLISGLSLFAASKDNENGARVFQLANSKEQARELFDECKAMVKASTLLDRHFETTLHEIRYGRSNSKIMPLATDSKKLDGKNASFAVFDEIHEYKTYKLINVIKNSTGARSQPMIIYITTAGYQLDGPLMDYYEKGADVLNGVIPDERSFYFMAELDPEDDINDPKNWIKANPSLGVTLKLETLIEEWESRQHIPAERNDFITKRLNRFVQSDEQSFIDFEVIKKNDKSILLDELKGKVAIGGFDLSQSEDFTSACLEFTLDDGRVFVRSHSWIPQKKVDMDNEKIPYDEWVKEGWLTIIKGDYVDYTYLYDWFIARANEYQIRKITYDPANAYRLVEDLKSYGFNCEPVRQGHLTLNAPLKDIKEMLLDGKVVFNKNRLFRWYLNNVKLVEDRNGNWLPTKQSRYRKIDGFAAWLNAHTETLKLMSVPQPTGRVEVISVKSLKGR
ncbi:MAG: terminase large subunit [Candidatus Pristimantibacillus lignocellulolyticus]|uniref:Terminase large subunit n=1 Tax=Candidatus Pristimantibacillus lignocellulolyticus TaxID=2994561 RepID=A0A9J6ZEI5_9BACL|nr:MAG: terminase large subunit [Candidatus Pristimantibacillus lignocellulolyticus]